MDISEHNKTRRRRSTFNTSGYQTENTSSDEESIPEWIWNEPTHRQQISSFNRSDRISSQTTRQGIFEPTNHESVYQRSLKHLPPVFERYQREIYRTREPITREPRGVRPLTSRRLRPFESGYKTNYSSDEESSIPDWLWSQPTRRRSTLESGFEEYIQPSTQPLEYQQFLQHLPPAFARYQQEIYGPRDPITGEPLGAEPVTRRRSTMESGFASESKSDQEIDEEEGYDDEDEEYDEESDDESSVSSSDDSEQIFRIEKTLPHLMRDKEVLSRLGFDVFDRIGSGNFGDVYRGVCNEFAFKSYRDVSTNDPNTGVWNEMSNINQSMNGKMFALKFISFGINCDEDNDEEEDDVSDGEKLMNEAKYMMEFNHMNVIQTYCVISNIIPRSVTNPKKIIKIYIFMEFSELGDIRSFIKNKMCGVLSEFLYKHIIRQSIDGLLYIHSKNIVHNDIKAMNFLVFSDQTTGDYIFKYTDFGSSAVVNGLEDFEHDLHDLCLFWWNLLKYLKTDSQFIELMRDFTDNLPSLSDWVYQTLQAIIDDNPWLLE